MLTSGSPCLVCVVIDDKENMQELADIYAMFEPGNIVTANDHRILPVYPDLDSLIRDTLESNFNSSLDKTSHFDTGDIDNLLIFGCTLLGDAIPTASSDVYTAHACMVNCMLDMDQLRTEIRLKAIKNGKLIPQNQLSAYQTQKINDPDDEPDYQSVLEHYDMERVYAHLAEAKDPSTVDLEGKFGIKES